MDALSFSERRLSKEELFVGFGGSVVVHAVVFATALILPWIMPHKSVQMPFYSVNLVSMQDLGLGSSAPKSGAEGKSSRAAKAKDAQAAPASRRASSTPVVPVRRLQFDETHKKPETTELKKLNTAEPPPDAAESVQPSLSIDKSLDTMIPKPKARPRPTPISQESGGDSSKRAAAQSSGTAGTQSGSEKGGGDEKAPAGQASSGGVGKGSEGKGAKGSPQGSEAGSPDGKEVGLARKLYYTEVWNAIRRQWALPEFLKSQKLEAVLVVVVRRDGKILSLQFEKKSGQAMFDESVERAVRKADPLPPFPEIYSPPKEEIGLRFRPEDLT
jgi:colicin import membrane protein